jgi:hypothetical protein
MVFTILASLYLRYWYIRENKKRDEAAELAKLSVQNSRVGSSEDLHNRDGLAGREDRIVEKLEEYKDLTDKQRRDFRYVY